MTIKGYRYVTFVNLGGILYCLSGAWRKIK